jgi:hypothetical protein
MNSMKPEITVKFIDRYSEGNVSRWTLQCPDEEPRWGRCRFIYDPYERNYDWLVVRNDIPKALPGIKEPLACPRQNTLFFTSEPSSITRYGEAFATQFGIVLTSQEEWALPHPNAIRSQTGNIWHYRKSYNELNATEPPVKTRLMSTVCSTKKMAYTMHAKRLAFTQRLSTELPEMDYFGRGVRYIETKADALDPYQFHLAIENHISPHHWTEKLADPLLGYSIPIYYGCTNVFDYFPEGSVIPIDIDDFDGSLNKIRRILSTEGEYERRLEALIEARRRVIEEYNLPAMLSRIIENAPPAQDDADGGFIYGRRVMRARRPDEFLRFAGWRAANALSNLKHQLHPGR